MSRLLRTLAIGALLAIVGWLVLAATGRSRYEAAVERFTATLGAPVLADLAPAGVQDPLNAARYLVQAAEAVDLAPWNVGHLAAADRLLAEAATVLAVFHQIADCREGSFEIRYEDGPNAALPDYMAMLAAVRIVDVEARTAIVRGNGGRIRRDLRALANSIHAVETDSLLISTLIGFAIDKHRLTLLRDVLAAGLFDDTLLTEVTEDLARRGPSSRTSSIMECYCPDSGAAGQASS